MDEKRPDPGQLLRKLQYEEDVFGEERVNVLGCNLDIKAAMEQ